MHDRRLTLVLLAIAGLLPGACGARTGLEDPFADWERDSGAEDSGAPDSGADDGGVVGEPCSSWRAAHEPVQVSEPIGSMMLHDALPVSSCLLVGYGNIDHPPVDPNWRVRQVCFDDGALGTAHRVFQRDTSELGWTAISLAKGFGRVAATAWDRAGGMRFVPIDETGAANGSPVRSSDLPGRGRTVGVPAAAHDPDQLSPGLRPGESSKGGRAPLISEEET